MHRLIHEGIERRVSFDTWQRQTNTRYEDDKASVISETSKKTSGSKNSTGTRWKPPIPPPPKHKKISLHNEMSKDTVRTSVTSKRKSSKPQQLSIDPKHFAIGSSRKREIIGGSHYSRALLVDAQPLTRGPGPENLKYLADVDHLFFKPCKRFPPEIKGFDPKNKRGIWNAGGRCVYYVGETNYFSFKSFRSGFTYEVVDYLGRSVLTSKGAQWNLGFKGQVSVHLGNGFLLGTMEQEFLSANYNIKDGQGRVVYTILAPCYAPAAPFIVWCFNEEFEICMDDGISEIGKIAKGWKEEFPEFDGDLGIEFESSDDNRVKALLLGVFFLLEFQYFKYGGNGVIYCFLIVILAVTLVFVLSNGFGFFPNINSPLVPDEIVET